VSAAHEALGVNSATVIAAAGAPAREDRVQRNIDDHRPPQSVVFMPIPSIVCAKKQRAYSPAPRTRSC
jgi:hypothetical protein